MMELLNLAALAGGAYLFWIIAFERIRHINWRTTQPLSVLMYLCFALWSLGTVYFALADQVHFYQLAGLVAVMLFLKITKVDWQDGAPERIKSDYGKFDPEPHHSVQ